MTFSARSFPISLIVLLALSTPLSAMGASKLELDTRSQGVLDRLYKEQTEAKALADRAAGILVFPRILQGGIGIGGKVGEGVLTRGGQSNLYYRVTSVTVGFQLGGQAKSQVIMFMTDGALRKFVESDGWEAGVDGSIAVIEFGAGKDLDTNSLQEEIIAFVFDNKGLMYNLSLEGSKFWKIDK